MFGYMRIADHEAAMAHEKAKRQADNEINQRALDAERAIVRSQRAEIEAMRPDYELGKKRRAAYDADNAKRKAARAGK